MSLQGAAPARRDFFTKSLLHFCTFLINTHVDLETVYIFRKPMNRCFLDILSIWNIVNCSRRSRIHFCSKIPHSNHWGEPPSAETSPFSWARGPRSNKPIPLPTPHSSPNCILINSCKFAQLSHRVFFGYNGKPHIPPKLPIPFDDLQLI